MAEILEAAQKMEGETIELAIPLPQAPQTKIHLRLSHSATSILLFLSTVENGDLSQKPPLGSFAYALPDRINPGQTLCTHIFTYEPSIDFTARMARFLAKKTKKPVYVGNSMNFASAGAGGTVEEEMEGFKAVVKVVLDEVMQGEGAKTEQKAS